jgi:hypothetical protein
MAYLVNEKAKATMLRKKTSVFISFKLEDNYTIYWRATR